MSKRLPPQPGEWIDRSQPISFQFEGKRYAGFRGDVLTSALWANGVRLMGRSFKYHRPRSLYSLSGYDANVIVENDAMTNMRGDLLQLREGLHVTAVNTWGGLESDRYRIIERFSSFLPVGFYYKAFHTPARLFPHYEKMMRRAAGLGRINAKARADVLPKDYDFCDVLVVGAGPAGLSAAIAAAESGAEVLLVDEQPRPGGSFCWQQPDATQQSSELRQRLSSLPKIAVRLHTQAAGWYSDQWIALVDERRLTKVRAAATVFATGCIEQPAVFHNNDLPGVMLGSGAQRLIHLYAVKPFDRAVVVTANADGYRVALDLLTAGVVVAAVVDLRADGESPHLAHEVSQKGVAIHTGHSVYEAVPNSTRSSVGAAIVCRLKSDGTPDPSTAQTIPCDGIVLSVGWAPNAGLLAQAGGRLRYGAQIEQLVARELPPGVFTAGRVNGFYNLNDQTADGHCAGLAAAAHLGLKTHVPPIAPPAGPARSHPYPIFDHPKKKNFIDLDEDIQLIDIVNAHHEGYDSFELMKRYSTVGMGPSQGKLSNMNSARVLARLNGQSLEQTGTTTARPFHHPVSIAHLAGRRFHPIRKTPMDAWHRQAGANMIHVGAWLRPETYRNEDKSRDDCVLDEALAVRRNVGLIDLSTLGKFYVHGPDASRFLDHIFTCSFAKLKVGRLRYAMACDETGVVAEEGVVARLADDSFYVTASTTGADAFYREWQRWALIFKLDVVLANATGHWAAMNLAGPNARQVLQRLTDLDITSEAFPYGAAREATVAGVPAVLMRAGFLGELSYEIHVPGPQALAVWTALYEAGRDFGIRPFGVETQRLLRLEKGHLIAGHDTDALTTPYEARLDWAVDMNKSFFIGKQSLVMLRRKPPERQLVGIIFRKGPPSPLPEECQLIIDKGQIAGRVTSIAHRSTLGPPISLAFLRSDLATPGTAIRVRIADRLFAEADVAVLPFYDPQNTRQKL